jgi:hypothetical protein
MGFVAVLKKVGYILLIPFAVWLIAWGYVIGRLLDAAEPACIGDGDCWKCPHAHDCPLEEG